MTKFYIVEKDHGYTLEDAIEMDYSVESESPDDALYDWLIEADKNSNFVDGYPDNWDYAVVNADTKEETILRVSVDWEPQFYIWDKV